MFGAAKDKFWRFASWMLWRFFAAAFGKKFR